MSLLYFDVEDELASWPDEIGTELPDDADVCKEAFGLLVDLAKDERAGATVKTVLVRDARGKRIFFGKLSLTGRQLAPRVRGSVYRPPSRREPPRQLLGAADPFPSPHP